MSQPHIAIIDWRTAPQGDAESAAVTGQPLENVVNGIT